MKIYLCTGTTEQEPTGTQPTGTQQVITLVDLDTQLLEIEAGIAKNEPVTYAVRKTIEGAVVELIRSGKEKGLWKYKAEPCIDPGEVTIESEGADGSATMTEDVVEEILEELIEADKETRAEIKEEAAQPEVEAETTPAPQPEQVDEPEKLEVSEVEAEKQKIPKEVFTQKLLDELECGVNPHKLKCLERNANETSDNDPTITSDDK